MHKCPANGCEKKVASSMLFCKTHWYLVPRALRDNVWREYRKKPGSDSHQMACQAAIESVNEQLSLEERKSESGKRSQQA